MKQLKSQEVRKFLIGFVWCQVAMDDRLARHERAALVASQAQALSVIAALQAKLEEANCARFGSHTWPAHSGVNSKQIKELQ
jgi:hypothetical protein